MRIDERIEAHVRQAFGAVIGRDGDQMTEALRGLDEADSQVAVGLALYVCGFVVNDIYREGATDGEVRGLAEQIVRSEAAWIKLDANDIAKLLKAAATGDNTFGGLDTSAVAGLAFVCGGHLVGAFSEDDQPWHQYLDEVWEAFEAEPEAPTE
jgi:hypothetical protein